MADNTAFLDGLYQQLGREPYQPQSDQPGMDWWTNFIAGGAPQAEVQKQFGQTPEFLANATYNQMLGRNADPSGRAYNMDLMATQGMPSVRSEIAASPEYLNRMLGPSGGAWQDAARQQTANQAQMPGNLWDYTNPALSNPISVQAMVNPGEATRQTQLAALLGIFAQEPVKVDDKKDGKKTATTGKLPPEDTLVPPEARMGRLNDRYYRGH